MKGFWIRRGLRFLGFAVVFAGLVGFGVMSLWNALLPPILGVSSITFWQALGLLVLSRILFGGFRGAGPGRWREGAPWQNRGFGASRREWKQKMAERWQQMTPEQREKMKQQWNRCGGRGRWEDPQPEQADQSEPPPTTPL